MTAISLSALATRIETELNSLKAQLQRRGSGTHLADFRGFVNALETVYEIDSHQSDLIQELRDEIQTLENKVQVLEDDALIVDERITALENDALYTPPEDGGLGTG